MKKTSPSSALKDVLLAALRDPRTLTTYAQEEQGELTISVTFNPYAVDATLKDIGWDLEALLENMLFQSPGRNPVGQSEVIYDAEGPEGPQRITVNHYENG